MAIRFLSETASRLKTVSPAEVSLTLTVASATYPRSTITTVRCSSSSANHPPAAALTPAFGLFPAARRL
ncbi:MAG: hypothetical protein M3Q33_00895 [Acidobacteriota bacterium]|nr:hypothetical protein [Acidobacteriota bacterium]